MRYLPMVAMFEGNRAAGIRSHHHAPTRRGGEQKPLHADAINLKKSPRTRGRFPSVTALFEAGGKGARCRLQRWDVHRRSDSTEWTRRWSRQIVAQRPVSSAGITGSYSDVLTLFRHDYLPGCCSWKTGHVFHNSAYFPIMFELTVLLPRSRPVGDESTTTPKCITLFTGERFNKVTNDGFFPRDRARTEFSVSKRRVPRKHRAANT